MRVFRRNVLIVLFCFTIGCFVWVFSIWDKIMASWEMLQLRSGDPVLRDISAYNLSARQYDGAIGSIINECCKGSRPGLGLVGRLDLVPSSLLLSLEALSSPRSSMRFGGMLSHEDPCARFLAGFFIGQCDNRDGNLLMLLERVISNDPVIDVRMAAFEALIELGNDEGQGLFERFVGLEGEWHRTYLEYMTAKIDSTVAAEDSGNSINKVFSGRDAASDSRNMYKAKSLKSDSENVGGGLRRKMASGASCSRGNWKSESRLVRVYTAKLLSLAPRLDVESIDVLIELSWDKDEWVRYHAFRALGAHRVDVTNLLFDSLNDSRARIRRWAVSYVGMISRTGGIDSYKVSISRMAKEDPDALVRRLASRVLGWWSEEGKG